MAAKPETRNDLLEAVLRRNICAFKQLLALPAFAFFISCAGDLPSAT
jgi:hypothetical protein